ncbi:MAG: hypothetical protein U1D55_02755 [Phycisphaerae bacterium]
MIAITDAVLAAGPAPPPTPPRPNDSATARTVEAVGQSELSFSSDRSIFAQGDAIVELLRTSAEAFANVLDTLETPASAPSSSEHITSPTSALHVDEYV